MIVSIYLIQDRHCGRFEAIARQYGMVRLNASTKDGNEYEVTFNSTNAQQALKDALAKNIPDLY